MYCNLALVTFMLRSKDTIWHEKQLPKRFAAGKAPAMLCNWLFYHITASGRVIPTTVNNCHTVLRGRDVTNGRCFESIWSKERARGGKKSH